MTPTVEKLYLANYIPLLNEIKVELRKSSVQLTSWMGKINTFKMMILPKIMYKFQMLPIAIPQSFFRIIKTMIKYIWQNKKQRVKFTLITRKKTHGGLTVPDINRYYKSVIISRMVEWVNEKSEKKWIKMENMLSKIILHKNIWVPCKFRILDLDAHDLTRNVFKIWDALYRQNNWVYNSPLIALTGINFLPPRRRHLLVLEWGMHK